MQGHRGAHHVVGCVDSASGLSQGEGPGLGGRQGQAAGRAVLVPSRAEGPSSGDCRAGGLSLPEGQRGRRLPRCRVRPAPGLGWRAESAGGRRSSGRLGQAWFPGPRQGAVHRAAGTKDKKQETRQRRGRAGAPLPFTLWILCMFPDSSHFPWHGRSLVLESGKQKQGPG